MLNRVLGESVALKLFFDPLGNCLTDTFIDHHQDYQSGHYFRFYYSNLLRFNQQHFEYFTVFTSCTMYFVGERKDDSNMPHLTYSMQASGRINNIVK